MLLSDGGCRLLFSLIMIEEYIWRRFNVSSMNWTSDGGNYPSALASLYYVQCDERSLVTDENQRQYSSHERPGGYVKIRGYFFCRIAGSE